MSLKNGTVDFYESDRLARYRYIEQEFEVEREPFHVCLMLQNRVVQENKRDLFFFVPRRNSRGAHSLELPYY